MLVFEQFNTGGFMVIPGAMAQLSCGNPFSKSNNVSVRVPLAESTKFTNAFGLKVGAVVSLTITATLSVVPSSVKCT